jgi:transposase
MGCVMPAMVRRRRCPDVGAALQRYERPAGARVQRTARACVEQTWRRSVAEALAVIDLLDERSAPLHEELRPFAAAAPRVLLLRTIPGIGELLGLTIAAEIGDIAGSRTLRWAAVEAAHQAWRSTNP